MFLHPPTNSLMCMTLDYGNKLVLENMQCFAPLCIFWKVNTNAALTNTVHVTERMFLHKYREHKQKRPCLCVELWESLKPYKKWFWKEEGGSMPFAHTQAVNQYRQRLKIMPLSCFYHTLIKIWAPTASWEINEHSYCYWNQHKGILCSACSYLNK